MKARKGGRDTKPPSLWAVLLHRSLTFEARAMMCDIHSEPVKAQTVWYAVSEPIQAQTVIVAVAECSLSLKRRRWCRDAVLRA